MDMIGYNYKDNNSETFENLILIWDGIELEWITISNKIMDNLDDNLDDEYFIMGFSLLKKDKYNIVLASNIKYNNILEDIKDNKINIRVLFDKKTYDDNRKIEINAINFDECVFQLKNKLKIFQFEIY